MSSCVSSCPRCSRCCRARPFQIFPLLRLPTDVIKRVLSFADILTLCSLSQTNKYLRDEVEHDELWKNLAMARFRVTPRVKKSRRLQSAHVNWKTLYANWHLQSRIPQSKFSTPSLNAFARGKSRNGAIVSWVSVLSTDDCKLINSTLKLRIITQNIFKRYCIVNHNQQIHVSVKNHGVILFNQPKSNIEQGVQVNCKQTAIVKANNKHIQYEQQLSQQHNIYRDDIHVLFTEITMPNAVFEIDALERIEAFSIPIIADGVEDTITCPMSDRQIWDSYELLPGGWWARVG